MILILLGFFHYQTLKSKNRYNLPSIFSFGMIVFLQPAWLRQVTFPAPLVVTYLWKTILIKQISNWQVTHSKEKVQG